MGDTEGMVHSVTSISYCGKTKAVLKIRFGKEQTPAFYHIIFCCIVLWVFLINVSLLVFPL